MGCFGETPPGGLSRAKLFLLTFAFAGIQFVYSLEVAVGTLMLRSVGVPIAYVSYVWLCGPVAGSVIQPLVGVASDRLYTRWGRRRPFLFAGMILCVFALIITPYAAEIGRWFESDPNPPHRGGMTVAIVGFCLLTFAVNIVQDPARTLLVDAAPPSQQALGNSLFSLMAGVGALLSYLMGRIPLLDWLPFLKTQIQAYFLVSSLVIVLCVMVTIMAIRERPQPGVARTTRTFGGDLKLLARTLVSLPRAMRKIYFVEFFSWFAWMIYWIYMADWVAEGVYDGNPAVPDSPAADRFNRGMNTALNGFIASAVVQLVGAPLLVPMIHRLGARAVYAAGMLVCGGALLATSVVNSPTGAVILIAILGWPLAVTFCVPYMLIGQAAYATNTQGMFMGVLSLFHCLPQFVVTLVLGPILQATSSSARTALVAGGVASLIASALVFFIEKPTEQADVGEYASLPAIASSINAETGETAGLVAQPNPVDSRAVSRLRD